MPGDYQNIIDYVRTQLDTFSQRDICRVDSLVLSCLSYYRIPSEFQLAYEFEGMPLRDLYCAEWFDDLCGKVFDPQSSVELLGAVAASPRFRNIRVCNYVSRLDAQTEEQFCAMTFRLSPRETYVGYRGTDNTLVGWKEDFNMAFQTSIPSQVSAVHYLERVAEQTAGRIWTGGHSKGGNLAVFAGMTCSPSTRERLVACYSHDGPGFSKETTDDPRWQEAYDLVDKTIPQSSVIGMLFENQEHSYRVVHSHNVGFAQHDPYSWEVDWRDFVVEKKVGMGASTLDASINEWLANTSPQNRERFVDAIFSVISASGMSTLAEMRRNWRVATPRMLRAATQLDSEDRQLVLDAIADITKTMMPGA